MTKTLDGEKLILEGSLLKTEEYPACKKLSVLEELNGRRARALLALDEGHTQTQAAAESGLTLGQVRYWLAKFRIERMGIFPETMLSELLETAEPLAEETPITEKQANDPNRKKSLEKDLKTKKTKNEKSSKQKKAKGKSEKNREKSKKKRKKIKKKPPTKIEKKGKRKKKDIPHKKGKKTKKGKRDKKGKKRKTKTK